MRDAPVLLVVDDDPQGRGVEGELRKRYGSDYQVIWVGPADDPLRLLAELRDDRRLVSIVLAGQWMSQMAGTELLARVREFHRTAKRVLLIDGTYEPPPESILQAIALGHIDAYVARPAVVPDERFHLAVTELLEEWARSHLPRFEVVRLVGEEWSARSHEIRDLLDRNVVPFGFHPADTEQGKALLQQAGAATAGSEVRSRAAVIATGVSYRRLGIPTLDTLTGAGVFYGAATSEAKTMKDREVFVVGGANSAGQAAVHLAKHAARVTVLVRGQSLAEDMSEYLVKEIASTPNIAVRHNTVVAGGAGTGRLESLTLQDQVSGVTETVPATAVFVLIGAEPRTEWLPADIKRDRSGFVVTGADLLADGHPPDGWPLPRPPMLLESSLPGVFAVGDVRSGSVKRVASAVGEGSTAIRLIHDYLRSSNS